ncbi:MAG: ATP-dependent DNA ligase [Gemmatimonadota bacterium]
MPLSALADVSRAVAATPKRGEKVAHLTALLSRAADGEVAVVVAWLAGELPQGRIGVGPALVREALATPAAEGPSLTVATVDAALTDLAGLSGPGSTRARTDAVADLFGRATAAERELLVPLLLGELRQGALEGVMVDAVARSAEVPLAAVRRALLLTGSLPAVARQARQGPEALAGLAVQLFRPLKPMLASTAESVGDALQRLGRASFEHKLDGARVQVHRDGEDVRVYTRALNEVTAQVPELVETARALPLTRFILDGETLALDAQGRPLPFQTTMSRFGTRTDVDALRAELPLTTRFFDALLLDAHPLLDAPYAERRSRLLDAIGSELVVPARLCERAEEAEAFLAAVTAAGHEGVIAKALDAPYDAGRRGAGWLKVKPVYTLDLVVLAAEWGHGRRQGWLSNLHLGARGEDGGWVMLGKTFKGMTDEVLAWQTEALQAIEVRRTRGTVWVEPRLVVEVAFDSVQASPRYPGGVALRFARLKGYRPDKASEEADTLATVRALLPG